MADLEGCVSSFGPIFFIFMQFFQASSLFGGSATKKLPGLLLQILFASNEKISVLRYYFTFMSPGIMGTSLLTMISFRVREEFITEGMFSSFHILWYTDLLLSDMCGP